MPSVSGGRGQSDRDVRLRRCQFIAVYFYARSTSTFEGRCHWLRWRSKYLGEVRILGSEVQPWSPPRETLKLVAWVIELVPRAGFFTRYLFSSGTNFRGLLLLLDTSPVGLYGW